MRQIVTCICTQAAQQARFCKQLWRFHMPKPCYSPEARTPTSWQLYHWYPPFSYWPFLRSPVRLRPQIILGGRAAPIVEAPGILSLVVEQQFSHARGVSSIWMYQQQMMAPGKRFSEVASGWPSPFCFPNLSWHMPSLSFWWPSRPRHWSKRLERWQWHILRWSGSFLFDVIRNATTQSRASNIKGQSGRSRIHISPTWEDFTSNIKTR